MDKHPLLIASTVLGITILAPLTYAAYLHHSLSLRIHHRQSSKKPIPLTRSFTKTITSLPDSAFTTPPCLAVHDVAWKIIPRPGGVSSELRPPLLSSHDTTMTALAAGEGLDEKRGTHNQDQLSYLLLTNYLRHTMTLFSTRLPQAYILRRLVPSPEARLTFQESHIRNLDFREGDLVCGLYQVVVRTPLRVEFAMISPPEMAKRSGVSGGRLVVRIEVFNQEEEEEEEDAEEKGKGKGSKKQEEKEKWKVTTETIMWKVAGERRSMPLETPVGRYMHELASWWLLERGTSFLSQVGGVPPDFF